MLAGPGFRPPRESVEDGELSGKQHVEEYRKYLLRRHLIAHWAVSGAAYVPFIGDGDLAAELYTERQIHGADLEPRRVKTAISRLPLSANIVEADCDLWPFAGCTDEFAIADFDAYADPYTSFRAFWASARKRDRLILIFTDGLPQAVIRTTVPRHTRLDGTVEFIDNADTNRKRTVYHRYFAEYVWPLFTEYVKPWEVLTKMRYRRGHMLYWGAVVERPKGARRPH